MNKPSKTKLRLIGIFVVPVIIIISVFSYLCFISTYLGKNLTEQKSGVKEVKYSGLVEDFDITEYNGAQKNFTIQGKKMQIKSRKIGTMRVAFGKVAEIGDATIIFYEKDKPVSTLISPKATMDLLNKEITFYDKVDVITQDKRLLTSDKVTWNNDEKYILAKGNCILDTVDGKRITGDLIKTDISLTNYSVLKEKTENPLKNVIIGFTGIKK